MPLQTILEVVGTSLVASAAAWGTVAYLSKTLLTKKITEELETYKSNLMKDVESFKKQLNIDLHQFSTQYSRLDRQRSDGIMQIHGLMCEIEHLVIWNSGFATTTLTPPSPETHTLESLSKAWANISQLNHVLNLHSLVLNEDVYKQVQSWSSKMMAVIAAIGTEVENQRRNPAAPGLNLKDREMAVTSILDKHLDSIGDYTGETRKILELEFRKYLGSTTST